MAPTVEFHDVILWSALHTRDIKNSGGASFSSCGLVSDNFFRVKFGFWKQKWGVWLALPFGQLLKASNNLKIIESVVTCIFTRMVFLRSLKT